MWRTRLAVPLLIAAAAGVAVLVPPQETMAQNRRWRCCLCGCGDNKTPKERADEAAALGVVGGAPSLGFCGSITGYELGVIRIPYSMMAASTANAGGTQAGSTPMSPAAVQPPPPPAAMPGGPATVPPAPVAQ
jgi:hypothetical protein